MQHASTSYKIETQTSNTSSTKKWTTSGRLKEITVSAFKYIGSTATFAYKLLNKNVPEMFLSVITTALRVVHQLVPSVIDEIRQADRRSSSNVKKLQSNTALVGRR